MFELGTSGYNKMQRLVLNYQAAQSSIFEVLKYLSNFLVLFLNTWIRVTCWQSLKFDIVFMQRRSNTWDSY